MGFFSWKLSDTNESLRNRHTEQGATPCTMLLPNVTVKFNQLSNAIRFLSIDSRINRRFTF